MMKCRDYILAVDEESRRIVFVNKAIRNSSVMTASQINEFILNPSSNGFEINSLI